jgi:hypothetical protein
MHLDTTELSIDEIIERVLDLVSRDAVGKGLALQVDRDPCPALRRPADPGPAELCK